jgi:pentatricopeptide repeat protein
MFRLGNLWRQWSFFNKCNEKGWYFCLSAQCMCRVASTWRGQMHPYDCEPGVCVASSLVNMYAKCGSIEDAWRVFHKMTSHDVVYWTVMILGHVKCGQRHWNYFNKWNRKVCAHRWCYFCRGPECMCQCSSTWQREACSWTDHLMQLLVGCLCGQ